MTTLRVIDSDIEFYTQEAEKMTRLSRLCHPREFSYYLDRHNYAKRVVNALIAYRTLMNEA